MTSTSPSLSSLLQGDTLAGIPEAARAALTVELARRNPGPLLCLTATLAEAERLADDCAALLPPPKALQHPDEQRQEPYARLFPEIEISVFDEGATDPDRLAVLGDLKTGQPLICVAPLLAFLQPVAPPAKLRRRILQAGQELSRDELAEQLEDWDYRRVTRVEKAGQYVVHGQVIDVFPATGLPKRVEFRDGKIHSLRAFAVDTQRSVAEIGAFALLSVREPRREARLLDYFPADAPVLLFGEDELRERLERMASAAAAGYKFSTYEKVEILHNEQPDDWGELLGLVHGHPLTWINRAGEAGFGEAPWFGNLPDFLNWAADHGQAQVDVYSLRSDRVEAALKRRGLTHIQVHEGALTEGYSWNGTTVLTDRELYGIVSRARYAGAELDSDGGPQVREGDLVVHRERGIGIFVGLVPTELVGQRRDLLKLEFAEGDHLLVPPHQMGLLTPYRGSEEKEPSLTKLDSTLWRKHLSQARVAIAGLGGDLQAHRAEREARRAPAVPKDDQAQEDMEAAFPFDETPSQLSASEAIKKDLEQTRAMDRLLCGDVGYGKTEVAMRAAFKAARKGQVAVLVPTTVLAQQHYEGFKARLEPWGVRVEGLWSGADDPDTTLEGLASGKVQVVVGTHSLLTESVRFRNLVLLVVDEEQQFGVAHKERLRELARTTHLLSMSATPIPRTLQLSLSGVRDISLLDAPPELRRPVRTYLLADEPRLWTAALGRELEREGQAFVLHNKVAELPKLAAKIQKLLPSARIAVAHGQMANGALEETLRAFGNRESDILVCSTIIEAGVNFPNVNTMVIKDAHLFGLAQLYQIRGRVGRAGRQAYCYLFTPKQEKLTDKARQRLDTIQQLTQLGSGFQIAMRDLEIRGAGDLLGGKQSGHIGKLGYKLYAQLLQESLRPEQSGTVGSASLELPVEAYLPTDFVADTSTRLDIYQRLAEVSSLASIEALRQEWTDRYGLLPAPVEALLTLAELSRLASAKGVRRIRCEEKFGERSLLLDDRAVSAPARAPGALLELVRKELGAAT